jgi:hypothetical protein
VPKRDQYIATTLIQASAYFSSEMRFRDFGVRLAEQLLYQCRPTPRLKTTTSLDLEIGAALA